MEEWLALVPFPVGGRKLLGPATVGFTMGAVRYGPFCEISRLTAVMPRGLVLCLQFGRDNFYLLKFTAMQVNFSKTSIPCDFLEPHVDLYTVPESHTVSVSFGNFVGGPPIICSL
jgi:hypothetical protein